MVEIFLVTVCTLGIVLYVQARIAARDIRRARSAHQRNLYRSLVLKSRN
ncbi:MAG: hypothetical protein AAF408_10000 [Pseudomonadota bacterium]